MIGDGSIQMLHTPSHKSMMVKLPARNFIVGADIARTKKNLEPIPCPADQDVLAAWRSIQRLSHIVAINKANI